MKMEMELLASMSSWPFSAECVELIYPRTTQWHSLMRHTRVTSRRCRTLRRQMPMLKSKQQRRMLKSRLQQPPKSRRKMRPNKMKSNKTMSNKTMSNKMMPNKRK
jgi:hypothetical protein